MEKKKLEMLPDDFLDNVSGGTLPDGWEKTVDQMAPMYLAQYKGITYEEACAKLDKELLPYLESPEDIDPIKEYIKKYFVVIE